jgi:hypothetical protein
MELQNFENVLTDGTKVVTLGITKDQNDIVLKMLETDSDSFGNYSLEEPDPEMVNVWISDAFSEGNEDYARALQDGLAKGADIYTLEDSIGYFHQTIGEVIVY